MKDLAEMSVKEMCELAHEKQLQIELRVEPNGYGGNCTTFTIQPWEKYEPFCPHGQPIVYVKERKEGR